MENIERRLIEYFAWALDRPAQWFSRDTAVRKAYRYKETWMGIADALNATKWMKKIRVKLRQRDMVGVSTIGELADLIASKAGAKIARLSLKPARDDRPTWLA